MMTAIQLLAGLILLTVGAEGLVRGSARLALRFGVSPLVVGLTVVAFGTSSPELVVSAKAAWLAQGSIAVGNVVGSNIINIAVILALAALMRPLAVQAQLIRFDLPVTIAASVLAVALFRDQWLSRPEAAMLLAGIIVYTLVVIRLARREPSPAVGQEFADSMPPPARSVWLDVVWVAAGLGLLVVGARLLVQGAVDLARLWGVGEAVIGLTVVALGTSMPELATSVVAAFRRQEDIAIGNIVGSNIFNLLAILGCAGLIRPLASGGVKPLDFYFMTGIAVILLPLMCVGRQIGRAKGALLLAAYGAYLFLMWPS